MINVEAMAISRLWLLGALACVGCAGDDALAPLVIPEGCNPLAAEHDCMLPYPNDFFLVGEGEERRVTLPPALHLVDHRGEPFDFLAAHPARGFSVASQILALFPQGIDEADLAGPWADPSVSLEPEATTVVIEATSGRRVLHMAEVDPRPDDPARQTLIIRPLERLADDSRYLVAIRGLRDRSGLPIEPPEGFRRLRDGLSDPALAPFARYESEVFAPLASAGVARETLQLAWDFSTRSREDAIGDMLAVRAQLAAHFAAHPPEVAVVEVNDDPSEAPGARRIEATIAVPLFMENAEPFSALHREGGAVSANGTVNVPFTIVIPSSVMNRPPGSPKARVVQFGHGFFGRRSEIFDVMVPIAEERGYVLVAADWWGMMADDRSALVEAIGLSIGGALGFVDRVHQGMANFMAVAYAVEPLAALEAMQIAGEPAIDSSELYFQGLSLGAILGGTYLALSPTIARGALGVGGSNFSFMMFRAGPFAPFLLLMALAIDDPVAQQKYVMLSQTTFDRIDPLVFTPLLDEPFPGGPGDKLVLSQIGIADIAVPNISAHLFARSAGLALLTPAPRLIAGLPTDPGPIGRALVEFDFGIEPSILAIPPIEENGVHGGVRVLGAANDQIDAFFQPDGLVVHSCDGPCDPE